MEGGSYNMFGVKQHGNFDNVDRFLKKMKDKHYLIKMFDKYGQRGVDALAASTPKDSGKTAASWYYEIHEDNGNYTIEWRNSNINEGIPIAILIQYGHGLPQGGYVQGVDYVNPAMRDVFENILNDVWSEVTSA